jgi:NitT/TauT family transport system permease protein
MNRIRVDRPTARRWLRIFAPGLSPTKPIWADVVVLVLVAVFVSVGARLAFDAPAVIKGPAISLSRVALPFYAIRSLARMSAAYVLSFLFSMVYGYAAARRRRAERLLMPLLDVLQSVPILSFLPVVLLSFSAILPQRLAAELASIVLIFTSQAWNLTFAWYQSLITIPKELQEASATFRLSPWSRLKTLELPFAAIGLVWNSMMSWAGGWFFLMAAEIFTVGNRDFRLPGLGAYLHEAANRGNVAAIAWGVGTLVFMIAALDQLLWRPLLAWSDRFKLESVEGEDRPKSWFYDVLILSPLVNRVRRGPLRVASEGLDAACERVTIDPRAETSRVLTVATSIAMTVVGAGLLYGAFRAVAMLSNVPVPQWVEIVRGVSATMLRVAAALALALAWTIPAGVAIGASRRIAQWCQPLVQVAASVPATALFPVVLLVVLQRPGGLNIAAVLLMLMGTQWYLLFNVIAGASAIPQDLKYTAMLLRLNARDRWLTLTLPALFPYIITGAITSTGGAWNASIVAEYTNFGGQVLRTRGLGALIAQATADGDYPLLLAATLAMVFVVVIVNRIVWHRLYRLAQRRYRLE